MADTKEVKNEPKGTVNADVTRKDAPVLTEVKTMIEADKEQVQIIYTPTAQLLQVAFSLQDQYENPSVFNRDALHDASVMFLKASCQRVISHWDAFVNKATKMQKYSTMSRPQIEDALKIHPKYKSEWDMVVKATAIKKQLA